MSPWFRPVVAILDPSRPEFRAPLALVTVLLALVVAADPALAQSRIFRCEGQEGMPPTFQNTGGKGCKELDLPPLNTVAAPRQMPRQGATRPTAPNGNFPKVESATQRDRDDDRRRLLSDELRREQDRLAELKKEFNGGEPERRGDERNYQKYLDRVERMRQDIGRAESSIGSLERELGTRTETARDSSRN